MKKTLSTLALIIVFGVVIPLVISAQAGPVKCVKLGRDLTWTGGYIYSGTVKNIATGSDVTCSAATPCKCNDPSSFSKGCLLFKDKTVGGEETGLTCEDGSAPYYATNAWGMIGVLNGVNVTTNWLFVILMIVVGLLVIWGAFDIVTAAGSPEKVTSGRGKIVWALVGLAVALLAKALPSIVGALLGV